MGPASPLKFRNLFLRIFSKTIVCPIAFGTTIVAGASTNAFQLTAREQDVTGIYYYGVRYYSPPFPRFLSEDLIGLEGGDEKFYAYTSTVQPTFTIRVAFSSTRGPTTWLCSTSGKGGVSLFLPYTPYAKDAVLREERQTRGRGPQSKLGHKKKTHDPPFPF
jgi:RHS repeat-associated protein